MPASSALVPAPLRRVMVVGQPGSGKSTFARMLGAASGLPVVHIDRIHWMDGWVPRDAAEKDRLTREVHARETWIFEGGHSSTWPERLDRADTLVWIDVGLTLRLWRILRRVVLGYGRARPDMPEGCPERIDGEFAAFLAFVWRTRHSARAAIAAIFADPPPHLALHRIATPAEARALVALLAERARPCAPGRAIALPPAPR